MKTIQLGSTPLEVSRIAYGCMGMGGSWDRSTPLSAQTKREAVQVIRTALDEGINFFDHADIYCWGKSEEAFAAIWAEVPKLREKIIVQSKCGIVMEGARPESTVGQFDFSYEHITQSVEGSLRRLQTDYVDVLLLHRPDPLVEPEEVARAFDDLYSSGKVRTFGVSNHTAGQMRLLKKHLNQPIVANQLELSLLHLHLFDEGIVFNQEVMHGEGTLEYCRQHHITIQAWGPLKSGAVVTGNDDPPSQAARDVAQLINTLAQEKGVSQEAIAIAWLLRHPAKIQPIIGTTRPERIKASCEADGVELTRDEWYRLFIAGRGNQMP
ncbi:MAG TPA: aldo/keto reductase [Anaerolineae bacterium]|nr:aldo/keto reductase [Anaerolineae bacterium]